MLIGLEKSEANKTKTAFTGRDLRKIYVTGETEVHALPRVDCSMQKGEVLVLLGPSGNENRLFSIFSAGWMARPAALCFKRTSD